MLSGIMEDLAKGKLSEQHFPFTSRGGAGASAGRPAQDVIVFFAGGVTYEESAKAAEFNRLQAETGGGVQVVCGGTQVLNMEMFLEELSDMVASDPTQKIREHMGHR